MTPPRQCLRAHNSNRRTQRSNTEHIRHQQRGQRQHPTRHRRPFERTRRQYLGNLHHKQQPRKQRLLPTILLHTQHTSRCQRANSHLSGRRSITRHASGSNHIWNRTHQQHDLARPERSLALQHHWNHDPQHTKPSEQRHKPRSNLRQWRQLNSYRNPFFRTYRKRGEFYQCLSSSCLFDLDDGREPGC